ncbi:MAG: hypothetical protein E6G15_12415 [Actinobacteria bacterium]|nr:MAG: hypothetical protein E6G15_12415 [Actinomycetota bacterium]
MGLAAMWPATAHFGTHFAARAEAIHGEASTGDHLQAVYHLWLVGHQLEHGSKPWLDPYTFQPESSPRVNFGGWPFGLPYWPLWAAFGPVAGWNLRLLLTFLAAGALTYLWLRELGLPRGAALVGGLVFDLAPYRVAQSAGHLRGMIAVLLPLALWAFERGRRGSRWWLVLAGAAIASIPFSDLHLALGAVPFFLFYALCRARNAWTLLGALVAGACAVGTALLVSRHTIPGSIAGGGRSLSEVSFYSAASSSAGWHRCSRYSVSWRSCAHGGWGSHWRWLSARSCRSCSRSGRTSRSTGRSGTTSRRCGTRACRSGRCRSRAWRSRRSSPSQRRGWRGASPLS